jgi:hypothetical protein
MGIPHRPAAITIDAAPSPAARGLLASLSREFDASPRFKEWILTEKPEKS